MQQRSKPQKRALRAVIFLLIVVINNFSFFLFVGLDIGCLL